mmetsp:Transcript_1526/g.2081  ORF Transcript_1526/g.2081 Transcript_1526/m.2081 type:complete len:143 (+) Transcript_1526:1873-2301(+)
MYSPPKARTYISRDSDPQMFEQLLLEFDENLEDMLLLSDFIPFDFEEPGRKEPSIMPFIFNLQRHIVERASKHIESIVIHVEDIGIHAERGDESNDTIGVESEVGIGKKWKITYEDKAVYFRKKESQQTSLNSNGNILNSAI